MGFTDLAQKILEYNRSLFGERSFLQEFRKPGKTSPSAIDPERLRHNNLQRSEDRDKRTMTRKVTLLIIGILILLSFLITQDLI